MEQYLCIDLKSFFASVECVERGLDPMKALLAVADPDRSEKTICLAVTPAMKALGVKNRCRIFEIPKSIKYIQVPPRMKLYMDYSVRIYGIYLEFVSCEDIHVYSVDEAFLYVTPYLKMYGTDAPGLARMILNAIYLKTGMRAACGVGTNMYLAKIALDITAKKSAEFMGVLDEESFCRELGEHLPLTDFWQIGEKTALRLAALGLYTMNDIARCSENILYSNFGVNAQLLIDHAVGKETATIADIKNYKTKSSSISSGQVLMRDYSYAEAMIIAKEMMDQLCLELCQKELLCATVTLQVGYSNALKLPFSKGSIALDIPKNTPGDWIPAVMTLYERVVDRQYPVRRLNICCSRLMREIGRQISIFDDESTVKNSKILKTVCSIKARHGKNAIFKGMDLQKGATALERNGQVGGHKSG